jgi:hypothetical protein
MGSDLKTISSQVDSQLVAQEASQAIQLRGPVSDLERAASAADLIQAGIAFKQSSDTSRLFRRGDFKLAQSTPAYTFIDLRVHQEPEKERAQVSG